MVSIVGDAEVCSRIAQVIPDVPTRQRPLPLTAGTVTARSEAVFLQMGAGSGGVEIEDLIQGARWLPVVPVLTGQEEPGRIMQLGALGVTGVLRWPPDEAPESWRRSVSDLLCSALGDAVFRELAQADPLIRSAVAWAVANAHRSPTIDSLAERMGASRRTLRRQLARSGGWTPGEILTLGRVVQGMYRLRICTLSVERIALIVGFASASGLRRALWRHARARPSELRVGTLMRRTRDALLQRVAQQPRLPQ